MLSNEEFDNKLGEFIDLSKLESVEAIKKKYETEIEEPPTMPSWHFTSYENELQIVTDEVIPDVEFLNINNMEFQRIRRS